MNRRIQRAAVIAACSFSTMILVAQESSNTAQKSNEPELSLKLFLTDGSHLVGFSRLTAVFFQTSYAKMDLPLAEVSVVTVAPDHETASAVMQNGDILKGVLTTGSIDLECVFGKIAISAQHIKKIQVIRTGKGLSDSLLKGLVLRLAFEADEGQKAVDSSPAGNHGTVHGAIWLTDEGMGGAYNFDGQDDYIELGPSDLYQTQGQLSGCVWVYRQSRHMIFLSNYRGGSAYNGQFDFAVDSGGSLYASFGQGPGQMIRYIDAGRDIVPSNEWHHVAFTYDERRGNGQKVKYYLDGVERSNYTVQSEGNSGLVLQTSDRLRMMMHPALPFPNWPCKGMIREIMLFNRSLSPIEIKNIYDMR